MKLSIPKTVRLAFLDELAKHIGHVERRNAREHTSHRWGYGPVVVWSASSGTGTALVMPYSSGSGVVRVHLNRYSVESQLLGWTAEISCMPEELVELAPWIGQYIRERSMGRTPPPHELFTRATDPTLRYVWTQRAEAHEDQHAVNVRGRAPVKESST
jgi:hypothetical protein